MNPGIVLLARMGSTRVAGKPLVDIAGRRALDILGEALEDAKLPVVLACPEGEADTMLALAGANRGWKVLRAHGASPLHRMAQAAKEHALDPVIRLTIDDLLIDPYLLRRMLEHHVNRGADYTYCWNVPEGTVGEVVRGAWLEEVAARVTGPTEHASYALRKGARVECFQPPEEYRHNYRLTLDTPEDLTVLRLLFAALPYPVRTLDAIHFLRKRENWYVTKINRQPRVTAYTCNHNQGAYVIQAAQSVLDQRGVDLEYILVDDGSTDDSPARLMAWHTGLTEAERSRVRMYRLAERRGLPAACNFAIERARGRLLVRLDADDFFLGAGSVERMCGTLKAVEDAAVLFSGYIEAGEDGVMGPEVRHNAAQHPGCAMMIRKVAHDVRFTEGLEHYEGKEFFARMLQHHQAAHLDEPLWAYRQHGASKSHSADPARPEALARLKGRFGG